MLAFDILLKVKGHRHEKEGCDSTKGCCEQERLQSHPAGCFSKSQSRRKCTALQAFDCKNVKFRVQQSAQSSSPPTAPRPRKFAQIETASQLSCAGQLFCARVLGSYFFASPKSEAGTCPRFSFYSCRILLPAESPESRGFAAVSKLHRQGDEEARPQNNKRGCQQETEECFQLSARQGNKASCCCASAWKLIIDLRW